MSLSSKIIFISKKTTFSDIVIFTLQSNFNFNIIQIASEAEFDEKINSNENYCLIICDGSISLGESESLYENFCDSGLEIPYFIIGNENYINKFEGKGPELFDRENCIDKIVDTLKKYFMENPLVSPSDYCPVDFSVLAAFEGLRCDVFIKLKSGRYLKIFSEEDNILEEDVLKYKSKGVDQLYLNQKAAHWILRKININFKKTLNSIESGEKINLDAIADSETNSPPEEPPKEKSFADLIAEIKNEKEAKKEKKIQESVDGAFKLSDEFKQDIEHKISKALNVMSKTKNLKKFFNKLSVDRNPDQYIKIHINLLCKISCAIAGVMEWSHESTLEKLIYVSYMHDITMVDMPHVARIENLEEFNKIKDDLSEAEQQMYLHHPKIISDMVLETDDYPVDAEKMIHQHHELPDQKGFPQKIQNTRFLPLSCLFIIAHDLVDYIIKKPEWDLDEYIISCKERFRGPGFTKIIRKLPELKV